MLDDLNELDIIENYLNDDMIYVTMEHLYPAFIFLVIGIIFSSIVFALEVFCNLFGEKCMAKKLIKY